MTFPVSEHVAKSKRHTSFYLACGAARTTPIIFLHGWPELSISWRHQLPVFASLGFRALAPDMRGYGRSSIYPRQQDYALEEIVSDMIELLDAIGAEKAVWVGHDWGSPVVWSIAQQHPQRCHGVANLCVPYIPEGFAVETVAPFADRKVYPQDRFPAAQWDYQLFYRENFAAAHAGFESNVRASVRALFRAGNPANKGKPALTAFVRANGGWFGAQNTAPDLPRDAAVLTEEDENRYVAALERNGFFGPDSWYMNAEANVAYAARAKANWRADDAGPLPARRLRLCVRDDRFAAGRADAGELRQSHRSHGSLRPLDGAGEADARQRGARQMARGRVSGAVDIGLARPPRQLE